MPEKRDGIINHINMEQGEGQGGTIKGGGRGVGWDEATPTFHNLNDLWPHSILCTANLFMAKLRADDSFSPSASSLANAIKLGSLHSLSDTEHIDNKVKNN